MAGQTSPANPHVELDISELESILGLSPSPFYSDYSHASPQISELSSTSQTEQDGPEAPPQTSLNRSQSSSSSSSPSFANAPSGSKSRKRVRPKVVLAPGQPPTARGNPRIRVFVACYQCRARKIRCDGAKPVCCNCQKRPSEAEQCNYDSGPNRRGREKGSGSARRREPSNSKKSKGKSVQRQQQPFQEEAHRSLESCSDAVDHAQVPLASTISPVYDFRPDDGFVELPDEMDMSDIFDPLLYGPLSSTGIAEFLGAPGPAIMVTPPQTHNEGEAEQEDDTSIPSRPGTQFSKDTWWDALLTFYATERETTDSMQTMTLSSAQRSAAMKSIMSDLKAVLQASPCWVSFLNLPRFFDTLFNPIRRHSLQPSLLLSALALGTLAQSSEVEHGAQGRTKALRLLEMAHGALEGALATGWVDIGLAHAAVLIVFFEMQCHPLQSLERSNSALLLLDSLIRLFSLTSVDEGLKRKGGMPYAILQDPISAYDTFHPAVQMGFVQPFSHPFQPQFSYGVSSSSNNNTNNGYIPRNVRIPNPNILDSVFPNQGHETPGVHVHAQQQQPPHPQQRGCKCKEISLGYAWPSVLTLAPAWAATMKWPEGLSEAEFRREEGRRLVWACVMVVANLNGYTCSLPNVHHPAHKRLFVREPETFALMTPGESLSASGTAVEADDIWTLCQRTMLLFHVCLRMREDATLSAADRAQLAVQAWHRIEDMERRLDRHTCELDNSFGFQSRELLFSLRMLTSYEFQNFIPQVKTTSNQLFYRDKAETWLNFVSESAGYVWKGLTDTTRAPNQDHRKSMIVYWCIANIRRALTLWRNDPGMMRALTVACSLVDDVEYFMLFWPQPRLRGVWQDLRMTLVQACLEAGLPPPSPAIPRIPRVNPT